MKLYQFNSTCVYDMTSSFGKNGTVLKTVLVLVEEEYIERLKRGMDIFHISFLQFEELIILPETI